MNFFIVLLAKIATALLKPFGKGSSFPGEFALKCNKNIMQYFKLPKTVIAVTGSSGKGSSTAVIAQMFRDQGYTVAHNASGANLDAGIVTMLLSRSNLFGKVKDQVVVLEVDERYAKLIFPDIKPKLVAITNLTRDQPPRQGHFDLVYEEIKKALKPNMKLILNADDPYLQKFPLELKNETIYYGLEHVDGDYEENVFGNLNMNYCPVCGKHLSYHYYHIEGNGDYYCSGCEFKRPTPRYTVTGVDYEKLSIRMNDSDDLKIPYGMMFGIYNTALCYAVASECGLSRDGIVATLAKEKANQKIFYTFSHAGRKVTVLNNKNENSSTFHQSLHYIHRDKGEKTVIIGWKEISRRYNFDDLSWLYDIHFEILNDGTVDHFICTGIHAYDIATRLKLAGYDTEKITALPDLAEACEHLKKKTKGSIYAVLNFDYVEPFEQLMIATEN